MKPVRRKYVSSSSGVAAAQAFDGRCRGGNCASHRKNVPRVAAEQVHRVDVQPASGLEHTESLANVHETDPTRAAA